MNVPCAHNLKKKIFPEIKFEYVWHLFLYFIFYISAQFIFAHILMFMISKLIYKVEKCK